MLLLTLLLVVTVRALMDCKYSDNLWNIIAMCLSVSHPSCLEKRELGVSGAVLALA